jgi:hypothetical protein
VNLIDVIKEQLAVESPDLQVSVRKPLFGTSGTTAVGAGSAVTLVANCTLKDTLAQDDGLWFDWIWGQIGPAAFLVAGGLTITDATAVIVGTAGNQIGLSTPLMTTLAPRNGQSFIVSPPPLLSARDIDREYLAQLGTSIFVAGQQPLVVRFTVTLANSTGAGINGLLSAGLYYRLVRGLREG